MDRSPSASIVGVMVLPALLTLAAGGAPAAPAQPFPRVTVETERAIGSGARVPARMRAPGYDGRISLKERGRWSRRFPKQSFGLELRDANGKNLNAPLIGMPADDDWVLYAAYNDRTLMRNAVAYAASRAIGRHAAPARFDERSIRAIAPHRPRSRGGDRLAHQERKSTRLNSSHSQS